LPYESGIHSLHNCGENEFSNKDIDFLCMLAIPWRLTQILGQQVSPGEIGLCEHSSCQQVQILDMS